MSDVKATLSTPEFFLRDVLLKSGQKLIFLNNTEAIKNDWAWHPLSEKLALSFTDDIDERPSKVATLQRVGSLFWVDGNGTTLVTDAPIPWTDCTNMKLQVPDCTAGKVERRFLWRSKQQGFESVNLLQSHKCAWSGGSAKSVGPAHGCWQSFQVDGLETLFILMHCKADDSKAEACFFQQSKDEGIFHPVQTATTRNKIYKAVKAMEDWVHKSAVVSALKTYKFHTMPNILLFEYDVAGSSSV